MTHDYVRHGTTSLFAAYDVGSGSVIAQSYRRHRHQEFLRFLKVIDQAVPKDLDLHLVLDNYATHKTPAIHQWLVKHPRFHLHFTPTSSSWLNLVERWFRELTDKALRRGAFHSVPDLIASTANNPPLPGNYFTISLGMNFLPTANLTIRPEARYDAVNGPSLPYADGTKKYQMLLGLDAIMRF